LAPKTRKNGLPIAQLERCDSLDGYGAVNASSIDTFITLYICAKCGRCWIDMLYCRQRTCAVAQFVLEVEIPFGACIDVGFP
jgi:hypothetical protein